MLDDLENAPYKFTSTTNEHSTRNEQHIPRYTLSDWAIQLLLQQMAQHIQQQQKQQLQHQIQQAYNEFKELLHQEPGFISGTDRQLMKSLSDIDDPEDPLLWESFPTPSTVPALPPYELDGAALIAKPLDALLDTDHIHDRVWYTSAFQNLDNPRRLGIHIVEVAFVLNNLGCNDQQIIDGYRNMFPLSLLRVEVLQWLITEGRWKAKSEVGTIKQVIKFLGNHSY
jgi:hypothetical protein